jgi:hypothetical protein
MATFDPRCLALLGGLVVGCAFPESRLRGGPDSGRAGASEDGGLVPELDASGLPEPPDPAGDAAPDAAPALDAQASTAEADAAAGAAAGSDAATPWWGTTLPECASKGGDLLACQTFDTPVARDGTGAPSGLDEFWCWGNCRGASSGGKPARLEFDSQLPPRESGLGLTLSEGPARIELRYSLRALYASTQAPFSYMRIWREDEPGFGTAELQLIGNIAPDGIYTIVRLRAPDDSARDLRVPTYPPVDVMIRYERGPQVQLEVRTSAGDGAATHDFSQTIPAGRPQLDIGGISPSDNDTFGFALDDFALRTTPL